MIYAIIRIKQWVRPKQHVDRRVSQSIADNQLIVDHLSFDFR